MASAIGLMLLVRAFMFTIYAVPTEKLAPRLEKGDRVIVNRLQDADINNGDIIVFYDKADLIGIVEAIPGDTVKMRNKRLLIPDRCPCQGCLCDNCKYYLVNTGGKHQLVNYNNIKGKAHLLFNL